MNLKDVIAGANYQKTPQLRAVLDCLFQTPVRLTTPSFDRVSIFSPTGDVVASINGKWCQVVSKQGDEEIKYTRSMLIQNVLDFCFENNIEPRDRNSILNLIETTECVNPLDNQLKVL